MANRALELLRELVNDGSPWSTEGDEYDSWFCCRYCGMLTGEDNDSKHDVGCAWIEAKELVGEYNFVTTNDYNRNTTVQFDYNAETTVEMSEPDSAGWRTALSTGYFYGVAVVMGTEVKIEEQ